LSCIYAFFVVTLQRNSEKWKKTEKLKDEKETIYRNYYCCGDEPWGDDCGFVRVQQAVESGSV
jgi:hypothetical protein